MWIKSAVLLCFIVTSLASDESRAKKKDESRGKRNLEYSIAHHYAGPGSHSHSHNNRKAERRISTGYQLPLYYPQSYFPAPRPYKGRPYTLPIPPYAVQMEPLVHYSQRDPLYDTNSLSLHADGHNDLAKPDDLITDTNHISENVYGPPQLQHHTRIIEKPVYIREPEPIIEIIIKESNVSLPSPPPIAVTPLPKKKEEVQVFYVKYKKNPNGHGKNSIIYDKPVPAISPPVHDEEEEESPPPVQYHHPVTQPPPPSTTHRTIIKPDSEVYHSPTGVKVTFGKEGFDYAKRSSKADDISRNTRPRTHSPFSQGRQLHSFPPNFPRPSNYESAAEYNFEPQRIPQPYRPFNQPNQPIRQPRPDFNRPPQAPPQEQSSQFRFPTFQAQPPARVPFSRQPFSRHPSQPPQPTHQNIQFQNQPLFAVPRQPVPYQPFENLRNSFQQPNEGTIQFRPETHFPLRPSQSSSPQIHQPSPSFNNHPPTHIPSTQQTIQEQPNVQIPPRHQFVQNAPSRNQQFNNQQQVNLQEPKQFSQPVNQQHHQNIQITPQHRIPQNNQQFSQNQHTDISQNLQHQVNFPQVSQNRQPPHNIQPQVIQDHRQKEIRNNPFQPIQNLQQQPIQNHQPQTNQNQQQQQIQNLNYQIAQNHKFEESQNHRPANSQTQAVSHVQIQLHQNQQNQQNNQNNLANHQNHQQTSQQNIQQAQYQQQFNQYQQQLQRQQQTPNVPGSQSDDDSPRSELIPSLSKYEQHISIDSSESDSPKVQYQFQQTNQGQQQELQQQQQSQQQNDYSNRYNSQQQSNHKQQNQRPSTEEYNRKVKQQLESVKLLQNNAQRYQQQQQQTQKEQPRYINNGFEAVQKSIEQNSNNQPNTQNKQVNNYATPSPTTYTTSQTRTTPDFSYIYRTTSSTTTTTEAPKTSTTTKDPKILEAQLPDEVPEDLRAQLLSSGILNHASISILDYDKVGDIPLSALPPDQLANFFNAGGGQQIAAGSEPVPSIITAPDQDTDTKELAEEEEDQEMEGSEVDEVKVKLQEQQGVEMKVVHYDPRTSQGRQVPEAYVREDATQLEPVELNGEQYNRYLPLKINGSKFPIPDVPELIGKRITSVVVLAPVTYDFTPTRKTRDTQDDHDINLIQGRELKELLKDPSVENYKRFLKSEKSKGSEKQSVILLVTGTADDEDKEIFMYNVATKTVNKLSGELSAAFVKAAEENAKEDDSEESSTEAETDTSSSNIVETRIPFTGAIYTKDNLVSSDFEPEAASSNIETSNVPIIDPTNDELETGESEQLEKFVDVSGMSVQKNEDLTTSTSQNIATSLRAEQKKTENERA